MNFLLIRCYHNLTVNGICGSKKATNTGITYHNIRNMPTLFTTYLRFFSHLGGLLSDEPVGTELRMNESVITGSDEEKAVAKAL